jgi:hypothetical protein
LSGEIFVKKGYKMTKLILEETVEYLEGNIWSGVKWSDTDPISAFTRSDHWQGAFQKDYSPVSFQQTKKSLKLGWDGVNRKHMNSDCDYDTELRERERKKLSPNMRKPYATSCSPNESNWMKFRWDVEDAFLPEDGEPTETRSSTDDAFCKKKWLTID